nr:PREDICTED: uncharacterized protein LOC109030465 [Bemisia tabaci]
MEVDRHDVNEEIQPLPRKCGRKSSFFRKSFSAYAESCNQTTSVRSTIFSANESTEETDDRLIALLKEQKKQNKVTLEELKDACILAKAQSFQDSFDFEKEFEAGMCDKDALKWKENLEFINAAPDYKGLFAKFESLKEKIALETRLDAMLKEAAANFAHAAQNKIQNSVGNVIQKLAEERLTMADILTPDLNIDSDGIMIPSFLNTSNSQIDEKENCMS